MQKAVNQFLTRTQF
ncbi:MAG: hypothetical protein LBG80_07325 [Bacteroidales bacterium]|nr:hypothetical protein [Bacteroidales bacterium]